MKRFIRRRVTRLKIFFFKRLLTIYGLMTHRSFEIVFKQPLLEWAPDIIHAHDGVTLPTAAHAAKELSAKLVFDSHELETHRNPPLSRLQRWRIERMERTYLPKVDKVITVSNLIADYLTREYKIDRATVVYNAPPAQISGAPLGRSDVRTELDLSAREFLFVYTGQATVNRGLELAVIALEKIQGVLDPQGQFSGDYHLAIVGGKSGNIGRELTQLAKQCGVLEKLHFLPPVPPHDVARYISTANASIIPVIPVTLSYEYAMPNKLFEAMLSGNPIIGADLMEMAPFISENRLGLTYQAGSPDDCVDKMVELITHFSEFRRSTERQRELAEKFAWEAQEKILLAMYDNMLAGR